MLVANHKGNYRFLPSTSGVPFCSGVIADQGYEIVHVTFEHLIPWQTGFKIIEKHLDALGRPRQALCGIELRCAAPYTVEGFQAFNAEYGKMLKEWELYQGFVGTGATARTNIAPAYYAPAEQTMFAFSYTSPSSSDRPTFILSGTPADEIPRGETSFQVNRKQVARIVQILEYRLEALGVTWELATEILVYMAKNIEPVLLAELVPKIGPTLLNGIRWFPGWAPVIGSDTEMGARGIRHECRLEVPL
jgi:hypothetical protein